MLLWWWWCCSRWSLTSLSLRTQTFLDCLLLSQKSHQSFHVLYVIVCFGCLELLSVSFISSYLTQTVTSLIHHYACFLIFFGIDRKSEIRGMYTIAIVYYRKLHSFPGQQTSKLIEETTVQYNFILIMGTLFHRFSLFLCEREWEREGLRLRFSVVWELSEWCLRFDASSRDASESNRRFFSKSKAWVCFVFVFLFWNFHIMWMRYYDHDHYVIVQIWE